MIWKMVSPRPSSHTAVSQSQENPLTCSISFVVEDWHSRNRFVFSSNGFPRRCRLKVTDDYFHCFPQIPRWNLFQEIPGNICRCKSEDRSSSQAIVTIWNIMALLVNIELRLSRFLELKSIIKRPRRSRQNVECTPHIILSDETSLVPMEATSIRCLNLLNVADKLRMYVGRVFAKKRLKLYLIHLQKLQLSTSKM